MSSTFTIPLTHSARNSNNPKSLAVEFQGPRGGRMNHRARERKMGKQANEPIQQATTRVCKTEQVREMKITSLKLPAVCPPPTPTTLAVCKTVHTSKDGRPCCLELLGPLVWEERRHWLLSACFLCRSSTEPSRRDRRLYHYPA